MTGTCIIGKMKEDRTKTHKEYEVVPLFHTPLYVSKMDLTDTEIQNLINQQYEDIRPRNGRISKTKYVLHEARFRPLLKKLNKHVDIYTRDLLKVKHEITFSLKNSWCMQHDSGHWAQKHYHQNSIISGVLYIKTSSTSGNIFFHNKLIQNNLFSPILQIPFEEENIHNSDTYWIHPEDGTLVMFPSFLEHSVNTNKSNDARYCLPFNYAIKGVLGAGTETMWSLGKEYESD